MAEVDLKTLTPENGNGTDYIIATDSAQIGVKALNNVVTTTGTQALTNKTLTNPIISGAVTLSSPTLTSPTMTAPVLGTVDSGDITACTGSPTLTTIELGAGATDTTIARSGAGAVTVEGSQVIIANTTVYSHMFVRAADLAPRDTNGPAFATTAASANGIQIDSLEFDDATEEGAGLWMMFPLGWDTTVNVKARFYWTTRNGVGTAGGVVWGISGESYADDAPIAVTPPASKDVTDQWIADEDMHITSATDAITIDNSADGSPVYFEIVRKPGEAGDTMATGTADASLIGVLLEFGRTVNVATAI